MNDKPEGLGHNTMENVTNLARTGVVCALIAAASKVIGDRIVGEPGYVENAMQTVQYLAAAGAVLASAGTVYRGAKMVGYASRQPMGRDPREENLYGQSDVIDAGNSTDPNIQP